MSALAALPGTTPWTPVQQQQQQQHGATRTRTRVSTHVSTHVSVMCRFVAAIETEVEIEIEVCQKNDFNDFKTSSATKTTHQRRRGQTLGCQPRRFLSGCCQPQHHAEPSCICRSTCSELRKDETHHVLCTMPDGSRKGKRGGGGGGGVCGVGGRKTESARERERQRGREAERQRGREGKIKKDVLAAS